MARRMVVVNDVSMHLLKLSITTSVIKMNSGAIAFDVDGQMRNWVVLLKRFHVRLLRFLFENKKAFMRPNLLFYQSDIIKDILTSEALLYSPPSAC